MQGLGKSIEDDSSTKVSGRQHVTTLDECKIHMSIRDPMLCALLYPHIDKEWEIFPHIVLASEKYWDLTSLDCKGQTGNEEWFDAQYSFPYRPESKIFNDHGECRSMSQSPGFYFFEVETYQEVT